MMLVYGFRRVPTSRLLSHFLCFAQQRKQRSFENCQISQFIHLFNSQTHRYRKNTTQNSFKPPLTQNPSSPLPFSFFRPNHPFPFTVHSPLIIILQQKKIICSRLQTRTNPIPQQSSGPSSPSSSNNQIINNNKSSRKPSEGSRHYLSSPLKKLKYSKRQESSCQVPSACMKSTETATGSLPTGKTTRQTARQRFTTTTVSALKASIKTELRSRDTSNFSMAMSTSAIASATNFTARDHLFFHRERSSVESGRSTAQLAMVRWSIRMGRSIMAKQWILRNMAKGICFWRMAASTLENFPMASSTETALTTSMTCPFQKDSGKMENSQNQFRRIRQTKKASSQIQPTTLPTKSRRKLSSKSQSENQADPSKQTNLVINRTRVQSGGGCTSENEYYCFTRLYCYNNFIGMQQAERKQWPKRRTLIKPLIQTIDHQLSNIFEESKINPEHFQPQQLHHIVGDLEWKRTFYGEIGDQNQKHAIQEHSNSISMAEGTSKQSAPSHKDFAMSTQKSNQTRFCLDQLDKESREARTLEKFAQTQKIWKRTEKSILDRVERNNSISYTAVKNLYLHPNPDKMTLINDNIPQYWQHSLRDNKKELKKYIRDNPFKQEIAEEMLQTLAGRKRLEKSIPQLRQPQQNILLKGRSIQEKKSWGSNRSKFFDQTYKADFRFKDRWLNEVNCTQTISSLYSLS